MLPKSLFVSVLQTVVLATTSSTATSQAIAATAAAAAAAIHANTPPAPGLSFLYTSFVNIGAPINIGVGPYGDRLAIPITGGNFTGKIQGTILDIGADWGILDLSDNTFHPDTRYNFQTNDGANIYIRSQGSTTSTGQLHLRFVYETGSTKYYWINNIVAIGIGTQVSGVPNGPGVLRIDTWNIAGEPTSS